MSNELTYNTNAADEWKERHEASRPIVPALEKGALMEKVITQGDLSSLSPGDRARYYTAVCESIGINPLTQPFEYLRLNGKLVLYAKRACAEQLRATRGISIPKVEHGQVGELYIVTAYAKDKEGREDSDIGAVSTANLKGEALANSIMKAITKAKRRVTLSICGLGVLDETEVETIPGARPVSVTDAHGEGDEGVQLKLDAEAAQKAAEGPQTPSPQAKPTDLASAEQRKMLVRMAKEKFGNDAADWIAKQMKLDKVQQREHITVAHIAKWTERLIAEPSLADSFNDSTEPPF